MHNLKKEVIDHLEGDSKRWKKLSDEAKKEYWEDRKLIKKLKEGKC